MQAASLDPRVDIMAQTESGLAGPVTFIALFHVPAEDAGRLLDAWYGEEAFILRQPGFISRELLRGRAGSDVFMDIAKWESAAHYKAALLHPEHLALLEAYGPCGGSSALHLLDPTARPIPLPAPVRDFLAAVNRGDTPAMLAFFDAETGVIIDAGRTFVGHAAIRPWNEEWFIGAGGQVTVKSVSSGGNLVTVAVEWKSAAYTGPSKFTFLLAGESITELRLGQ
jgi:heme-degrading monooxygenase HmoA